METYTAAKTKRTAARLSSDLPHCGKEGGAKAANVKESGVKESGVKEFGSNAVTGHKPSLSSPSNSATAQVGRGVAFGGVVNPTPVKRFSRDEMNLAEFPLAVLSTRHDSDVKTLEFCDSLTGKNGERIERKWIITGADKFGLPTASDDEVLLGLLRLSASQEFRDRKITFTRYELLRILKWSTEGRSYGRLQRALDRLSGVRIKTSNGFFDNSSKSHQTRNFGVIDAYEINDGRGDRAGEELKSAAGDSAKPSFFVWSEAMFTSFQSGFIKKLDLDFLLELKSAVSKRLYRFLDKHFWYRSKVQYNLFTLAHEKIGISRNYAYASQLKQQLEPAIEELISRGFLQGCEYAGKGSDTEIILVAGLGNRQAPPKLASKQTLASDTVWPHAAHAANAAGALGAGVQGRQIHNGFGQRAASSSVEAASGAPFDSNTAEAVVTALEQRGLAKPQALRLAGILDERLIRRAWLIIQHFDQLVSTDSTRVSKNPAGFLYRAIERIDSFVLPGEKRDVGATKGTGAGLANTGRSVSVSASGARTTQNGLQQALKQQVQKESTQASILKAQRESLKHQVEPQMLERIRAEVTVSLEKLRGMISAARFHDTVEHAVEERLARLLAV